MNIELLKGIGPKTSKLLNKLGIYTIDDLIYDYPYRYEVLKRSDINNSNDGDRVVIDGILEEIPKVFRFNGKSDRMSFRFNTGTNLFNVYIYNRGYLKSKLEVGTSITLIGKIDKGHNTIIASEIRFGLLPDYTVIEPIYHVTPGITSKQVNEYINNALPYILNIDDYLTQNIIDKYNFNDKLSSIKEIHNPTGTSIFKSSLSRLKFEELFIFMLRINYLKNNTKNIKGLERNVDLEDVNKFISNLPFKLTKDQETSINSIYNDLISPKRMNRLLQGDVGSGKTIVSFIALYINYLSGYQGALMAPTEILANQHYINMKELLKDYDINIRLLTGKLKISEKNKIYKDLKEGKVDIVIGTHALFQSNIEYNNLGLVITDEQHRFGVNQRSDLKNKGITPDILYMSATPIPRTYALTIYGDMDVSSIKTMPSGRKDIITEIHKTTEIKEVLEKMYNELLQNHQIYVVAPLIEESDKSDLENVIKLEEKMNKAFGTKYNVGVLHGKMDSEQKNIVMNSFKNNDIQILISTTVVEVGVDVENATMMVIWDAYRFGLSALHQLRGSVGRSNLQSYCLLISDRESKRLEILCSTNDGFKVSEEDFKLRGSGDLFGERQSGDMAFKLADLKNDFSILLKANDEAKEYFMQSNKKNICIEKMLKDCTNLD